MKTSAVLFLLLVCFGIEGLPQNRISTWNVEEITAIQIDYLTLQNEETQLQLHTKAEIEKVVEYLSNVSFTLLEEPAKSEQENDAEWLFRITFHGLRDQVYLFDDFAFIGKTTYSVNKNLIQEFRQFVNEL